MSKNPFDDPNFGNNFLSDEEKQSQAQAPAPAQAQTAAQPSGFRSPKSNPYDDPNYGAEPEGRTWGEVAKDTGAAVMQGFATMGGDLAWMADKATGGVVDIGFQKAADRATEYWQDAKSDQMKESNQALAEADGFTGVLKTAWDRPEVIPDILASSAPYMLPTGIAGRAAGAVKGAKAATAATIGVGGALEGANAGRETENKVRDMTAEKLAEVSPQYMQLINQGVSHDEAAAQVANRAGLTAFAVSAPLAMLASKVTGAGKLEADFFSGKGLKGFFDTVLRESAEEMAQEASNPFGSNVGIKTQVNPDQSLSERVPEGAALGLIAGAGQGTPMAALQSFVPPAKVQPTPTPDNPNPDLVDRPDPSNGPLSSAAAKMPEVQTAADLGMQFPEQKDWSQYDRPTVQRQQEGQPARANDAVTNMVMQARQMGDSDAEVRLETANRLYRTIDKLMAEGNEEQARWNAYRADQIIREVSPRLPQAQQAEGAQTAASTLPALITDDGVDLRDLAAQGQERAIGAAAEEAAKNQLIRKTVDDQTFAIGKVNQRSEYYSKLADLAQSLPRGTQMVDASTNEAWSVQASDTGVTLTNDATGQTATLQQNETGTWTRTGEVLPPTEFKLRGNLAPVEQAAPAQETEVAPQQAEMLPTQAKPAAVQKDMIERALDRLTSEGATGPEANQQIAELERIQQGLARSGRTADEALAYLDKQGRYDLVRTIDPDAIKLDSKGQPFASEDAARKSQTFQEGKKLASVVPYGDGFAVRIDTAAQRQAELEAMRKKEEKSRKAKERYHRPIDPNRDDLLTAIALAGGINRKHAVEQGIDPDMLNIRGNHSAPVFTKEGDTADGMAQTLGQYGYINADSNREQDLLNKLMRAVNGGQRIMTPDGIIAEAEAAAAKEAEFQEAEEAGETVESVVADYIVEAREAGVPEDTIQSILESNKDNAVIAAVDLQHEAQILQNASVRSEEGNSTGRPEDEISLDGGQPLTPELAAEIFGEPEPLLTTYTEQDLQEQDAKVKAEQDAKVKADQKAEADAQVDGFTLSGSNRPADVATSQGQQDLLGGGQVSQPDPNTVSENWRVIGENLQGHEVSENTVTGLRSWRSNSGSNTEQGRIEGDNTYESATDQVIRNRRVQYKTRSEIEAESVKDRPNDTPEFIDGYPVVMHTTKKGKVLRGIVRTDLTKPQALEIDPYTLRKNGGWFIRDFRLEEHKAEQGEQSTTQEPVSSEQPATTAEQAETGQSQRTYTQQELKNAHRMAASVMHGKLNGLKAIPLRQIAKPFLESQGVPVPRTKAETIAAVTDFDRVSALASVGVFNIELSDSVMGPLQAEMEGRITTDQAEPAPAVDIRTEGRENATEAELWEQAKPMIDFMVDNAAESNGVLNGKPSAEVEVEVVRKTLDVLRRLTDAEVQELADQHNTDADVIQSMLSSGRGWDTVLAQAENTGELSGPAKALKQIAFNRQQQTNQQSEPMTDPQSTEQDEAKTVDFKELGTVREQVDAWLELQPGDTVINHRGQTLGTVFSTAQRGGKARGRLVTLTTQEGRKQFNIAVITGGGTDIVSALDRRLSGTDQGAKPTARNQIGTNRDGKTLFEDENGVRYYVESNVRISEPVLVVPGQGSQPNVDRREGSEFETQQEVGARLRPQSDSQAVQDFIDGKRPDVPTIEEVESEQAQAENKKPKVSENTIFTEDAAEKARALLNKKFGQLNSGIDPEIMQAGITLAGYHIEKGARTFAAYAKAMTSDLGERVKPYLKSWYMGVKYDPRAAGFDGMDDAATVDAADIDALISAPATLETEANSQEVGDGTTESEMDQPDQNGVSATAEGRGGSTQPSSTQTDTQDLAGTESGNVEPTASGETDGGAGVRDAAENVADDGRAGGSGVSANGRPRTGGSRTPDAGTGSGSAAEGGRPAGGNAAPKPGVKDPASTSPAYTGPGDYHIDNPLEVVGGGQVARFNKNKQAIELFNDIRDNGRTATREEQDILAGYTGWGSFGQELFQGTWNNPKPKAGWEARDAWLREQLGQAEWESMQRSITNAHYTDPPTVMAMWDMVKRMGFEGGRVLEPSMGIGNFYGMMPMELKNRSQLSGIELDMMTGGMAKMLYPNANIKIMGYQESKTPDDFYDVVIGNWPFENTAIADRRYNKFNPMLHDYFFLKTLDQVRPGGIVIGITSKGSMDKKDSKIRSELAKKAELVASYRLPSGAFEEYAGTKVVTDIIILKKRAEPLGMAANEGWIKSVPYMTPQGQEVFINEYYASHPDHVIGTIEYGHGTTFNRPGMIVTRPNNMAEQLQRIVNMVPQGVFESRRADNNVAYITNHTADREGSLTQQDGKLYVVRGEHLAPAEQVVKYSVKSEKTTAEREQQLRDLIGIRQAYAQLIEAENGLSGSDPEPLRKELRKQYNAFTKANGPLNASWGLQYLKRIDDPFRPALAALESERNGKTVPAAILERSTIRTPRTIDNPTVREAFVLARNESVNPTLDKIAELSGKPAEEVKTELIDSGAVFELPGGDIAPSDIYLSGNVREKMRQAVAALEEGNAAMQHNIDELQKVMPKDVPYFNIEAQLGASWVPTAVYEEYVAHMLDAGSTDDIRVTYAGGKWKVDIASRLYLNTAGSTGFGTPRYNFKKLVNAAFGNQTVTIKAKDSDGNEFVDEEGSAEVNGKISDMRSKFKEWLWQDPDRRLNVEREYNEVRNAYATPRFDGSFLRFDGMALTLGTGPFNLRQHQADAIWRALVTRRSLNAHEVGTGKTFTMGGIAIESRRYGIAKKPLILAHNANSASVAHEIEMMYPAAKVLYIDNLDPKSIERKMRQIANDDWDAVVLPHSQLSKLALREDTLMAMAQEDIAELERQAIEAAEEDGASLDVDMMDALLDGDKKALSKVRSPTAKDLVKMRNRVIETIRKQGQKASKANAISFEELGIDMLLVDEAHVFKKPPFATRMKMKGLNTQASDASIALNFLARYVRANNNGGNIHLFTGTPVTNTLTEVFHMMRYIMNEEMQQQDLDQWDGWFNSFASEVMDIELNGAGEYEPVTRLAGFINVPELRKMIGQYMDTVFADDMPEMQPRKTASGKTLSSPDLTELERADLLNGRTEGAKDRPYKKVINESSDLSPEQMDAFNEVKRYAQAFRNMTPLERKQAAQNGEPEAPLIYERIANEASFDVRLLKKEELAGQEGKVPDHPNSKISRAINNILEIYHSDDRATQVVFSDTGLHKTGSRSVGEPGEKQQITFPAFSPIHDMIERLVQAGIPREQIALIAGSNTSKEKRKEIAEKMNRSEIRVVLGSTASLGVGVNMQKNLRAMHHLDAPWMPGDLEQRNGRGHRQGNQWNTVLEYRYLTDRIDGRRWQVLAVKQRFINAFLKANEDSRIIEGDAAADDGSDILESFSEAAGDPRILIRKKMESKLEQMRQRRRLHDQGMVDAKNRVAGQREKLRRNQQIAKRYEDYDVVEKSQRIVESNAGANFTMKIGDQTVTDRKTAQELIDAFIAENVRMDGLYQEIGEFGGEQVLVGLENGASVPYLKMRFGIIEAKSNSQKVITLENALRGLPKAYDDLVAENAETEQNIQRLIQVSNEPFSQEKELQRMEQDLAALEQDIQDNPVAPPVWLRNGAPLETEVQWKGKPFEVTGHRWNSEGWFVLAKDASGSVVIPYTEVTDNQGMPLYEEREFESPDVVTKDQDQSGDDAIIKDTPQFSRTNASVTGTPLSVADLDTVFNRIAPRLKNGQGYRIFENVRDLFAAYPAIEQHARKQGSNGSDVEGVFHKGQILIVRNKVTSRAQAEALMFHEATHGGVNAMMADEGITKAANRLFMAMGGGRGFVQHMERLGLQDKLKPYIKGAMETGEDGKLVMTQEERREMLVHELLAFTGEKNSKGIKQKARELIGFIRQWFRKHGYLASSELSTAEISYMARQARKYTLGGKSKAGAPKFIAPTMFSRSQESGNVEQDSGAAPMFRRSGESEADLSVVAKAQRTLGNNDRNAWDKVKRTFKRNFTAAGLLPDNVYREKVLRDSEVNSHEFDTAHYLGALDRAVSKAYGTPYRKLTDVQREAIDAQMKSTEPDMSIPEPVRVALMDMRRSIAGLSMQYAEILQQQVEDLQAEGNDAEAMEKAALLETIISNMDTYAHRSYRAFDDPKWPAKVSKDPDIFPQAVEYLKNRQMEQGVPEAEAERQAIRIARTILEEGTAYEDMTSLIKESKLGAKDLSTLKRRKDIAPEIRALLGEYKDAKINYAKTLAKMSRLVANTKLLDRIKEIGLGEGWLFTEDTRPLDESFTKIAADGSEVYAPLNGYYVPNDINQALIDVLGKDNTDGWLREVIRWNGMVKYGKTVLSPTTAFRNWMSAAFFAMANGHFDITQMRKSISGFKEYFGHGENADKLAYLRKLKELGVVYDTAYAGEMMDLLADAKGGWAEQMFSKPGLSSLKAANDMAQKFYQYGDDFWKIIGFENEKAMLMKHKGMSEAEAEVEAAERIRNTYPTYSMTGRAVNWLRRFPLAGTFVSFPAEIIRTQFHMLRYLKQDMKDSPAYAARKVVGLAMVSGLAYAAQALSKDLFDIGDDEEEAVRLMAASWNSNSNIWFRGRDEEGNLRYLDFSFLDPYNYFKRPINAIMRDQPMDKAAIQAAGEMLSPFFGTDIAFGAISEIWNNKKASGARVYEPEDDALGQAQSIANHLRKAVQPGFVSNIERAFKAANGEVSRSGKEYKASEEVAAFFGFRSSTFDPKTALYYNSFEFQDRRKSASNILMNVAKNPNEVSNGELMRAYETARTARFRAYSDMVRLINAARASGMNDMQIRVQLAKSGISRPDIGAMMAGFIPEWRHDGRSMRNMIDKAELLYKPEVVARMRERERAIIQQGLIR